MKVGFGVIPNEGLVDTIISFQHDMRDLIEWVPTLSDTTNLPHLTLIQGDFEESLQYTTILDDLQDYLSTIQIPLSVSVQDIFYQHAGWYFLRVQKEPWLVELHNYLFALVKRFMRPGQSDPDREKWLTPLETQNFQQYGYRYIGDAFLPHITLGRNHDMAMVNRIPEINERWNSINIASPQRMQHLTVYVMGDHGSHARTLASVSM